MERLRLAVKKDGALQFLSHLDFARAVRYVIVRAHLPINYSEGFNPHLKKSPNGFFTVSSVMISRIRPFASP